ncbi:hypothetical protein Tco_0220037, partial [Tanacetum coccineum]
LTMTQRKYALELLQSEDVLDLKPSHIPVDPLAKLNEICGDLIEKVYSSQQQLTFNLRPIVIVIGQAVKQQEDPQLASASFLAHALFPGNQEANCCFKVFL